MGHPSPLMATSSGTEVPIGKEDTPGCEETEAPSSSSRVHEHGEEERPDLHETEYGTVGSPPLDQMDGGSPPLGQMKGGDIIMEPKSGMEFDSFEELMEYYRVYAKKCNFGSMTQRSERDDEGNVRYVTIGCTRGGKVRNRTMNVAKPHPTGKTDCKARINALKIQGKMRLTTVHNTHNHGLKPPILKKDCRNYIDKAKHLRLGAGGAGALQDYFARMQYKNPKFFALMDLDDDGRLKNVFWADPRSRAAYQDFGDVVTFDTTYLTNRYGIPFAPFVGINHHGQSILFGAGLISSEDTETFTWLFQT
ncbi:protein FAR-RED IMPAIRED RESPONSE 1-like [Carya illinoinensis]|uniref:protein FAR-RED IMPAIRED RESPONSE 1-like n=1 Tax=Carya illinoinensis TaxID=32201 RepID=UPI001C71C91A|nr:protein FAR-RED IMPAIRED RESPONSE 1-like [Carya illinoinensis]